VLPKSIVALVEAMEKVQMAVMFQLLVARNHSVALVEVVQSLVLAVAAVTQVS
jgi:hypothetical protein